MNIKNKIFIGILVMFPIMAFSQNKKTKSKSKSKMQTESITPELKNQVDSISYSLGINIGSNLKKQGFDTMNVDMFAQALKDVYGSGTLKINEKDAEKILMEYFQGIQSAKTGNSLKEGQLFLEENKKKPGVITLPSGLQYMVMKEGTGPKPAPSDMVTTHYHGSLINGTVFDSSVERGQPATFPVNGVIQGWVEALQLMNEGSKWKLFIPANLAYGEQGAGQQIPPHSALIFEVELISIAKK